MAVVAFDPSGFLLRYPEFDGVSIARLGSFFNEAGLYCNNTDASKIMDLTQRKYLLWMVMAHIAYLSGAICADGVSPVGRISSGTEGSVSSELDYMEATPGSGPWFQQTQYGAAFWQATVCFRGFRYRPRQTVPW